MSPRERIGALIRHVDALSLRERIFVLAAILMVSGAVWEGLLNGPPASMAALAIVSKCCSHCEKRSQHVKRSSEYSRATSSVLHKCGSSLKT